ncbi:dihydropteridine reductase isoform 1 [Oopsacas minuta]|uniref:Dihydropteridine reductase n=1 Tax=Oopsacas minuta TaxID=111878 RepID=A0AAV7KI86_9METZ|nr:dihydropteridine reductase isoform 1 [Oopsacas minuta]
MATADNKLILIYGGKGALGSCLVTYFKSKQFSVISVDLFENTEADKNITLKQTDSWVEQETEALKGVADACGDSKLEAIFCVAGGWAGGNAASHDMVKNADLMVKQSVWSSVIAARIASKFLKVGGVVQLTGAQPATKGTAFMMGYGLAKAAVHQLVASLSSGDTGLPDKALVFAILPVTLDTPGNRKAMSGADTSTWTPLLFIAEYLEKILDGAEKPGNGSLLQLFTEEGKTSIVPV